jgi:hypothetical protein
MDPQEIQKLVDEYEAKFSKAGDAVLSRIEDELDSLVHDFKANEASDINNAGIASQLEYIIGAQLEYITRETLDKLLAYAIANEKE